MATDIFWGVASAASEAYVNYQRPQLLWPGSHIGMGIALVLTMTVVLLVGADLEASMWSAAKPVISIPRTRARTAIFIGLMSFSNVGFLFDTWSL